MSPFIAAQMLGVSELDRNRGYKAQFRPPFYRASRAACLAAKEQELKSREKLLEEREKKLVFREKQVATALELFRSVQRQPTSQTSYA